jgi:hypothetical protein
VVHLKEFGPSSDSCDIRCAKKGVKKYFQCSKAMDQCGENYKTLFTKDFHILVFITILNYNTNPSFNKHTPNILSHIFYPKRNSNELYKDNI